LDNQDQEGNDVDYDEEDEEGGDDEGDEVNLSPQK